MHVWCTYVFIFISHRDTSENRAIVRIIGTKIVIITSWSKEHRQYKYNNFYLKWQWYWTVFFMRTSKLFIVVQSLSCVWFFVTLWTAGHQASLSLTIFWSLLKLSYPLLPAFSSCPQSFPASYGVTLVLKFPVKIA